MAAAYVLATELERHPGNHRAAFAAYENLLKPATTKKQRDAAGGCNQIEPGSSAD